MRNILSKISKCAMVAIAATMVAPTSNAAEVTGWGDFRLFLDPGHSGRENQGLWGYSEAEKVLDIAHTIREYLKTYTDMPNTGIMLCRETGNETVSLTERTDAANAWDADFYYSIHSDAGSTVNTLVTLFGGWYNNGTAIEKLPKGGKEFGEYLEPNLKGVMRIGSRGNYYDRYFYDRVTNHNNKYPYLHVNRESNMASILSEGGYHTIDTQQQRNINAEYKRLEAYAAFRAILQYCNIAFPVQTFLTGVITNSENNVPINGATITIGDKTYTTDTYESVFYKYTTNPDLIHNGFYLFEGLEGNKEVEVKFEAPGFDPVTKSVTIKSVTTGNAGDNVTFLDVALTNNRPAIVSGISLEDLNAVSPVKSLIITFSRKMDRTSVEQALSINNDGVISTSWEDDCTLLVNITKLVAFQSYTITIDGSIAKNSQTGLLLDGDNNGEAGGNYTLSFTMAEPDITAPVVVSTDPAIDGEVVYTLRPVIRIEYDKELNWDEDKNGNCITVTDAAGNEYAGKLTHAVVRNKSVLHFYFNNDLPLDKAFLVTVKGGLNDLYGNPTDDFFFRFLSEYRPQTAQETVLALDNTSGWWVPNGSGSTKGLVSDEDGNTWTSSSAITASQASNSSCWLHYTFDPSSADGLWQIREYYSSGSTTSHSNTNGVLTFWLYGDASNNSVSAMLRATSSSGGLKHQEPQTKIDFRGWKLVAWDLKNDPYTAFTGTDALSSVWRLDSFFLRHVNESGVNKEWSGDLYFDNLEFNKWDNSATRTAKLDDVTIPSGIEDVVIDNNSPAEYFNLQGMKVARPSKGIFIKRQGNKTSKVVL
jgi:N-acetylmuramoyl-L-alanine amidase